MPYGLTCDNCLKMFTQSCGAAAAAPVAAVVSDIRSRGAERDCAGVPGPDSPISCSARRLYQFGQVEFLSNSVDASASDLFEAYVVYPEVYTADFETSRSEGPLLEPDKRYVIFGYPDRRDLGFAADWYINIACEIQGFDTEGAIHD